MADIRLAGCRLKGVSVSRDETLAGKGEIERHNRFRVANFTETRASVVIKDSIDADLAKGFGARYEAELEAILDFEKGLDREAVESWVREQLDEPVLSMSNVVFAVIATHMGIAPVVLPPVWESVLESLAAARQEKEGTTEALGGSSS